MRERTCVHEYVCLCVYLCLGKFGITGKEGDRTNTQTWQVDEAFQSNVKNTNLEIDTENELFGEAQNFLF